MIAERMVASWVLRGQALALAAGLGVAGLAELVERSQSASPSGSLLWIVLLRVLLTARELLPILLAVGLGVSLAWRRQTGELVALAASGVRARRVVAAAALSTGVLGLLLAAPLELGVPKLRDRLQELEAADRGQHASVEGRWIFTGEAAIRVGSAVGDTLRDVTVVPLDPSPPEVRFEIASLRPGPDGWQAEGVQRIALGPDERALPSQPPLPGAELLSRMRHAAEPIEQSAIELAASGLHGWAIFRIGDVFAGFFVGLLVASLSLRGSAGPAMAAAWTALLFALWRGLALKTGAGAWPLGLLLLPPLGMAWRPTTWESRR